MTRTKNFGLSKNKLKEQPDVARVGGEDRSWTLIQKQSSGLRFRKSWFFVRKV